MERNVVERVEGEKRMCVQVVKVVAVEHMNVVEEVQRVHWDKSMLA